MHKAADERGVSVLDRLIAAEVAEHGLGTFVAREKCLRINEQRRAIRRLGRCLLSALIHRVFEVQATDSVPDHVIANEFGLSKATYSRFAGSRWSGYDDKSIPDLWRNVAQIVAHVPSFREAATRAGVWSLIETINQANDC